MKWDKQQSCFRDNTFTNVNYKCYSVFSKYYQIPSISLISTSNGGTKIHPCNSKTRYVWPVLIEYQHFSSLQMLERFACSSMDGQRNFLRSVLSRHFRAAPRKYVTACRNYLPHFQFPPFFIISPSPCVHFRGREGDARNLWKVWISGATGRTENSDYGGERRKKIEECSTPPTPQPVKRNCWWDFDVFDQIQVPNVARVQRISLCVKLSRNELRFSRIIREAFEKFRENVNITLTHA